MKKQYLFIELPVYRNIDNDELFPARRLWVEPEMVIDEETLNFRLDEIIRYHCCMQPNPEQIERIKKILLRKKD